MAFIEIINSLPELKEMAEQVKKLQGEAEEIMPDLKEARGKVSWKDKLNIFSKSAEEKVVSDIKDKLSGKQKQMEEVLDKLVGKVIEVKIKEDPQFLMQILLRVLENIKDKTEKVEAKLVESGTEPNKQYRAEIDNKDDLVSYANKVYNSAKAYGGAGLGTAAYDFTELGEAVRREILSS